MTSFYIKWWKWVDTIALFQLHDEDSWLFSSSCNATSLVVHFLSKKSQQKVAKRGRQNFNIFTKLCEPSFQAVWPYNTVLSDVLGFKRCLCNTSTEYKWSEGVQEAAGHRHLMVEGDKILTYLKLAASMNKLAS